MKVGIPKEIKNHEYRVGLIPSSVKELTRLGHQVFIQSNAGSSIGFDDNQYKSAGAEIVASADEIFEHADLIIKVKEPQPQECQKLRQNQILFTYLHLAPDPVQAQELIDSQCIAIAYETVTDSHGGLPLLAPMSEVAGRMSIQVAAWLLEKGQGGSGVLLGGVAGVTPAKVVVLGGGVVGANAARMAMGMGADVTIVDKNPHRLNELDWRFQSRVKTIYPTYETIENLLVDADVVVGAVLVTGGSSPKLVTREMLGRMKKGSVMMDVAIDQGGCFETSHPTTHQDPTYVVDGVIHYCVTNMPGAVARTSAMALNNATLPYIIKLAQNGYKEALLDDPHFRNGLNVCHGFITHEAVAKDLKLPYKSAEEALNNKF